MEDVQVRISECRPKGSAHKISVPTALQIPSESTLGLSPTVRLAQLEFCSRTGRLDLLYESCDLRRRQRESSLMFKSHVRNFESSFIHLPISNRRLNVPEIKLVTSSRSYDYKMIRRLRRMVIFVRLARFGARSVRPMT